MAQRIEVVVTDDIDGSEGAETVQFAFDGKWYEIDLGEAHRTELTEALAFWMQHARSIAGPAPAATKARKSRSSASRSSTGDLDPGVVREWARQQGMEVNERGRIAGSVVAAYRAAHSSG